MPISSAQGGWYRDQTAAIPPAVGRQIWEKPLILGSTYSEWARRTAAAIAS